ncbi:MAG: hypothetical protein ABI954_01345 [Pyrinomonadaceae bacterium]
MLLHARTLFCACALLLCASIMAVNAQEDSQSKNENNANRPSYEVSLQLLVSTQNGERDELLPSSLAVIEKKLKSDFGKSNYRLAMNLINRVSERGSLEISGVSPFSQNLPEDKSYNFYELNLSGIKSNTAGEMQFDQLRFGLRLPLVTYVAQEGKSIPITSYQNLGISARPVSVAFNEPTIIGTMTTPRPNELIVLVLTVKPSDAKTNLSAKKN